MSLSQLVNNLLPLTRLAKINSTRRFITWSSTKTCLVQLKTSQIWSSFIQLVWLCYQGFHSHFDPECCLAVRGRCFCLAKTIKTLSCFSELFSFIHQRCNIMNGWWLTQQFRKFVEVEYFRVWWLDKNFFLWQCELSTICFLHSFYIL